MQSKSSKKNRNIDKAQARQKRLRKEKMKNIIYAATGCALLGAILFFVLPFFQESPTIQPPVDRVESQAFAEATPESTAEFKMPDETELAALEAKGIVMYTPVPTPSPTPSPTPEPTPEPSPTPLPGPTPYAYNPTGRTIDPTKKMVAITFDDGPSTAATESILKVLKDNDAVATFFMLGSCAMKNPDIVKAVAAGGNQIATHTYDHKSLTKLTAQEMLEEVEKSRIAIRDAGGGYPTMIRPPYGNVNDLVKSTLEMPLVNWSVDTLDWKSRDADKVYKHIIEDTKDGSVVLMHDLYESTAKAVKKAIPALKKKGYQFVTIDELFMYRGPQLAWGKLYTGANSAAQMAKEASATPAASN